MAGDTPNSRVTTAQFYEALLKQNERMDSMERRIITRLDTINDCVSEQATSAAGRDVRIKKNEDEIEKLRTQSNIKDVGVAIAGAVGAAIAAVIGSRQ